MNEFDLYKERMRVRGLTRRDTALQREQRMILDKMRHSLSFHHAIVNDEERDVVIINSDNLNEKMIYALPGEDIANGAYVDWMNQMWLVTEKDYNNEVYTRAKMFQCNYLLKWVDSEHVIHEQWAFIEDGTKYLTGELEDRNFVITRGDSRIAITLQRNEHTAKLGRLDRFLVDDPLSGVMLAYANTKPLKFAGVYGKTKDELEGVVKFVCQEVNSTDDDNFELGIADYYKHFTHETDAEGNPVLRPETPAMSANDPRDSTEGRRDWLSHVPE